MRLLKSAEEIQALERSAELGDIGLRSMQERVRPGMTEGEVFGIVHEAVLKAGGEMGMIQIGSCSMLDPDINDQRPRPVERVIGERDIINNELGIFYNGYEAQCGRPVVTGGGIQRDVRDRSGRLPAPRAHTLRRQEQRRFHSSNAIYPRHEL